MWVTNNKNMKFIRSIFGLCNHEWEIIDTIHVKNVLQTGEFKTVVRCKKCGQLKSYKVKY